MSVSNEVLLDVQGLQKAYGSNQVLNGITTQIRRGEVVAIIGPSGSGKSTLLRCATMLETMDHGEIVYLGKRAAWTGADGKVSYADKKDMKEIRSQYGLVFQNFIIWLKSWIQIRISYLFSINDGFIKSQ